MIYPDVEYHKIGEVYRHHYEFKVRIRPNPNDPDDYFIHMDEWTDALRWGEDQFGPMAMTMEQSKYRIDSDARWAVYWPTFYFRDIVDATHFKLRWG